jgi:phosphate transport system substrate-binding protein
MYIKKAFRKNKDAVSPVVATLILVLVAVASATAFFLWQTQWQQGQTDKINESQPSQTLTLAGSTTVYELAVIGADGFQKAFPLYKVSVIGGGSSAGVTATIEKTADIGMVSSAAKLAEAQTKNADVRGYTLGYDAVTPITSSNALTAHGITSANWKMNATVAHACFFGYPFATGATQMTWGYLGGIMNGTAYLTATGVMVCPYVPADTKAVTLVDRSDSSGTEAYMNEIMIGSAGKDKQMQDNVAPNVLKGTVVSAAGNTGVIATVAASSDAIGFASAGIAAKSAGIAVPMWSIAAGSAYYSQDLTTLMTKVSTANNIRPLIVMTVGPAQGLAKDYIDFMMDHDNNIAFCAEADYLSLYKA